MKNRLGELLRRPGGIHKEQAVTAAMEHIESLRDEYTKVIPSEIEALETIIAGTGPDGISAGEVLKLLNGAERLLVLSGTFGYPRLEAVVKSFCDFGIEMVERRITDVESLKVHLRAMWLFRTEASKVSEADAKNVLNELSKIHTHFKAG
jgi:hypothetical protein